MDPGLKTDIRKAAAPNLAKPFGDAHYYTSSIKIFHLKNSGPRLLTGAGFLPMPADAPIRGFVCKAARLLLGQTQDWLAATASVSRKTLFDFEAGDLEPKIALNNRLRRALEAAGASFISGEEVVGVIVFTKPTPADI
jgi:DNA-binding XRE family transcriptional regulator